MADREHKQKAESKKVEETEEIVEAKSEVNEELNDEVDSILDEIDNVLEENAEDFVQGYRQMGGE